MPKQRDIVLIPVPFTDLSTAKRRPVLVLSSDSHNSSSPDVMVAAITSNLASTAAGLVIDTPDMENGALPHQSLVRGDKIYTLSQTLIVKSYGRLSQRSFDDVLTLLDAVLGR
jgi:mRNA interferase MazF